MSICSVCQTRVTGGCHVGFTTGPMRARPGLSVLGLFPVCPAARIGNGCSIRLDRDDRRPNERRPVCLDDHQPRACRLFFLFGHEQTNHRQFTGLDLAQRLVDVGLAFGFCGLGNPKTESLATLRNGKKWQLNSTNHRTKRSRGGWAFRSRRYRTSSSSTSKASVALGGMVAPAPLSP